MARDLVVWMAPKQAPAASIQVLAARTLAAGGAAGLGEFRRTAPGVAAAHVHGSRHDLWWEFQLIDSFRWQAMVSDLPAARFQRRLFRLAVELGLVALLDRPVEELTLAERARADLAVALLPRPEVLVWEEPFCLMPDEGDRGRVAELVRHLNRTEGLTVVAAGSDLLPLRAYEAPLRAVL